MTEKIISLEEAAAFDQILRAKLLDFGFSVSYSIENPTDKNGDTAFGFFPAVITQNGCRFRCNVDGEFTVIYADCVVVKIT